MTNVPAQSLALLNDPNVTRWASLWARQVVSLNDDEARVQRMFVQALGRAATADEVAASLAFVNASGREANEQQGQLAVFEAKTKDLQQKINAVLDPFRAKLTEHHDVKSVKDVPVPYAEWDFEKDANDLQGHLPLTLEGGARLDHGMLVLDGTGFARSAPLKKNLSAKTLEAWVLLDTLDQHGGGVMTVQDLKGVVFDSIVFAENQPNEWLAGSDFHKRTLDFKGAPEADAAKRPVHVAITYAGGKTTCYRDGVLYGNGYKVETSANFKAGESQVLLGCRHGNGGGNKLLHGRILRARLYDRALTVPEIEASRLIESSVITDRDVFDALSETQRTQVRKWQTEAGKLIKQADGLKARLGRVVPETAGWESLALSVMNLKEFIYLK